MMKLCNAANWRGRASSIRRTLSAVGVLAIVAAAAPAMAQVYVHVGPPAARVEVIPPLPGRGYAWQPGHWYWHRGHWVWYGGRYVHAPHGHAVWVSGHWVHRPHGWVYYKGHWR